MLNHKFGGMQESVLRFDEALCEIARKLLTATANYAGLERQFSTLKLTYGMLRTNLGAKKLENLHFVIDRWIIKLKQCNCSLHENTLFNK